MNPKKKLRYLLINVKNGQPSGSLRYLGLYVEKLLALYQAIKIVAFNYNAVLIQKNHSI
jgi:hypothetical protein